MRGLDSRCVTSSMHHGTPFKWYAWSVWNAWCCTPVHRAQQGDVVSLCRCRPYRVMEMVRWRKRRVMRAPERSLNKKEEEERGKEKEEGGKEERVESATHTKHTAQQHNSTHTADVLGLPQHRHDGDGDVSEGPGRHDVLNQVQEGCR